MTTAPTSPAPSAAPLLRAEGIVAGYLPGIDILHGCSLELHAHEVVGIIGPNGAGKSTLLKSVFGLVPVRSGTIALAGVDIVNEPAFKLVGRGLGYVPQRDNVFASLTVEENLEMGLFLRPREWRARFDAVTEIFPLLAERRKQRSGSLSGGERQLVAMGRALMMEPTVLLLDEPSAGLSPKLQEETFERVVQINESGVAILMVEQNATRCLEISHRGYVLDQGTNAYTGTGADLLDDPKVVELYLGSLARRRGPRS